MSEGCVAPKNIGIFFLFSTGITKLPIKYINQNWKNQIKNSITEINENWFPLKIGIIIYELNQIQNCSRLPENIKQMSAEYTCRKMKL